MMFQRHEMPNGVAKVVINLYINQENNEIIKNYSYLIINYRLQAINNVKYYLIVIQLKYLCYFCAVLII